MSEALYLRDPDGNGLELYRDRPRNEWPRAADGSIAMVTEPLDLEALMEESRRPRIGRRPPAGGASISPETRSRLGEFRMRLLALHKALIDDARAAYELDRGRIPNTGSLLQLVIHDPWFAWLHQLSELVVRIDELTAADSTMTEADVRGLIEQVDRLLVPSETGDLFARRYYEAIQRQPAVVLAHGHVRKLLKTS